MISSIAIKMIIIVIMIIIRIMIFCSKFLALNSKSSIKII